MYCGHVHYEEQPKDSEMHFVFLEGTSPERSERG